ncbi:Thioredoxin-like fold,Thioredoxin, conserved site,Thioredoxin domain [Cinara cedri]|uniref:Thioredoxin-like fold,Thioredoxin, conserved site,Thioredoxin domain n=1 Tax=Cinara cedri TaxID=506608 RepID=A0A5E4N4H7_9HEMI|nr:Thioredoxin-like fold,Thioredoxin, conserved site,Thioredoxin domain [Cinara cedri]
MTKKGNVAIQDEINNNEDWKNMLEKPGIYVVDIYTDWCGPCVPMVVFLRKIKLELNNENLHFAIAKSDEISALERFRQKSEPHWMFLFDGKLVNLIIDTNGPKLLKIITDEVENPHHTSEIKLRLGPNRTNESNHGTGLDRTGLDCI